MKNKIKIETSVNAEAIVNEWFLKTIHETIIQQDTALFNKFHAAKDELIKSLKGDEQPIEESK